MIHNSSIFHKSNRHFPKKWRTTVCVWCVADFRAPIRPRTEIYFAKRFFNSAHARPCTIHIVVRPALHPVIEALESNVSPNLFSRVGLTSCSFIIYSYFDSGLKCGWLVRASAFQSLCGRQKSPALAHNGPCIVRGRLSSTDSSTNRNLFCKTFL